MPSWLEEVAGPNFAPAVLWTLLALVVLIIVLVVVRIVRSMTFGTFVVGGRNRKTRLAVMDAAAVDSQRRLVLVRRDDIEHLILIGGPTDVVVERDIRLHASTRRPSATGEPAADAQAARPRPPEPAQPARVEQRRPAPQQPAARAEQRQPAPSAPPPPAARTPAPAANGASVRMAPVTPQPNFSTPPRPAPAAAPPAPAAAPKPRPADFDKPAAHIDIAAEPARKKPEMSLEDEMNRLLGELSNKR